MRHIRQRLPDVRQAVLGLLLLPFLLVALLPQGFMPSVADDGTFTVTLCTSDGLRTVTLDANGEEVPDNPVDDEGGTGPCLFAGIGQFATLYGAPDLPAPASAVRKASGLVQASPRVALYRGALGARAPPALL